jgi:hypothetical protein
MQSRMACCKPGSRPMTMLALKATLLRCKQLQGQQTDQDQLYESCTSSQSITDLLCLCRAYGDKQTSCRQDDDVAMTATHHIAT